MTKFTTLALIAICFIVMAAGSTFAAAIIYERDIPLEMTNWTHDFVFPKFDPSLGTLDEVTFELSAHVEGTSGFENLGPVPATVVSTLSAALALTNGSLVAMVVPVFSRTDTVGPYDGRLDYAGTSGMIISGLLADKTSSANSTDPEFLAHFIGTDDASLSLTAEAESYLTGPGSLAGIFLTSASAHLKVTYVYTQTPGSIGDRVWNDLNKDGVQDDGEPGINGVTVTLKDGDGNTIASTVTEGDGIYAFPNLAPGAYTVSLDPATIPAGFIQSFDLDGTLDGSTTVPLAAGESRNDVDFGYWQPASIGDRVWADANGDGVQDSGELGIEEVTVELKDADGNVVASVLTGTDGIYTFENLTPGTYTVSVDADTLPFEFVQTFDLDGTLDHTTTLTLAAGEKKTDVDFGYWRPASIGDRVWEDIDGDGTQDAGEVGINGVKVILKDTDGNEIATATTSGDGAYSFPNLAAGTYTVNIDPATVPATFVQTFDLDGTLDGSTSVALAEGDDRTDVDFGYVPNQPGIHLVKTGPTTARVGETITYHFKVTNTGNTYLYGGITVSDPMLGGVIWHKTPVAPGEVNEFDKTYVVKATDHSPLVNTATATGTPPTGPNVTSTSSWTVTIISCVKGSIGDRVWKDCNGNGIQDAGEPGMGCVRVQLYNGNGYLIATTTTSSDGSYKFTGLSAGNYVVKFSKPCGYSFTAPDQGGNDATDSDADQSTGKTAVITLAAGQNNMTVDAGLTKPGSIGDQIWIDSDSDGLYEPALGELGKNGVKVELYDAAGRRLATTCTTNSPVTGQPGWYSFTKLDPGSYTVVVSTANFGTCGALRGFRQTYDLDRVLDNKTTYVLKSAENFTGADFGYVPNSAPGTGTPGYWKNHPCAWPVDSIVIGGVTYSKAKAICLLGAAEKGDKTITMFRALVCAKLNVGVGNTSGCIESYIAAGDAWMAAHPVGSRVKGTSTAWRQGEPIATMLDKYNNGLLCAPHRD